MNKEQLGIIEEILLNLSQRYPKTLVNILEALDITDQTYNDIIQQLQKED